jgi:hypothetical protein
LRCRFNPAFAASSSSSTITGTSSTYRVVAAIVALRARTAARVLLGGDVLTALRFIAASAGVSGLFCSDDDDAFFFDAEDVPVLDGVSFEREATRPAAGFRAGLPVRVAHMKIKSSLQADPMPLNSWISWIAMKISGPLAGFIPADQNRIFYCVDP